MINKTEFRKKILKEAYINGIYNKTRIEDRLDIKLSNIEYVLEKLKEKKYFLKERHVVDLKHFNIGYFAWLFVSINWIEISEKDILEKLNNLPYVHTISEVTGTYDIAIKIIGKDYSKLNEYVFEIENILSGGISDIKTYYLNKEIKSHYLKINNTQVSELKHVDKVIVIEKDQNPKISLLEISKKYNIHRNTVSKRWKTLWKNEVLLKKTLEMTSQGYKFIDLGLKVFIIIQNYPGKTDNIIANLIKENSIQDIFTTLSNVIIAIVRVEDSLELSQIHKKISKFSDIKKTETIIFLKKHTKPGLTSRELNLLLN